MQQRSELTREQVVQYLVKGEASRVVLLFQSEIDRKRFVARLADDIRREPTFQPSRSQAFRVASNLAEVQNTKVIFGLKKDEPLLVQHYGADTIAYFKGTP
jgi:hypothetical protein